MSATISVSGSARAPLAREVVGDDAGLRVAIGRRRRTSRGGRARPRCASRRSWRRRVFDQSTRVGEQVRVRGHVGARRDGPRVEHVAVVPEVRVAAALAREVGAGALGAPLEGVVEDGLLDARGLAVADGLGAHRADHLRVAVVAALADVDVAALELEGGVGRRVPRARGAAAGDERGDELGDAADEHRERGEHGEDGGAALDQAVPGGLAVLLGELQRDDAEDGDEHADAGDGDGGHLASRARERGRRAAMVTTAERSTGAPKATFVHGVAVGAGRRGRPPRPRRRRPCRSARS